MIAVVIIALIVCVCLVASVLLKPNIEIRGRSLGLYWIIALAGALVILCSGLLSFDETFSEITKDTSILKKHEVEFSFATYIKYGIIVSVPTLFITLLGLAAVV